MTQRFSAIDTELFIHPHLFQSISLEDGPEPAVNAFQNILIPLISVSLVATYQIHHRDPFHPHDNSDNIPASRFQSRVCSHILSWMGCLKRCENCNLKAARKTARIHNYSAKDRDTICDTVAKSLQTNKWYFLMGALLFLLLILMLGVQVLQF